jgi:hypothetical protein
VRTEKESFDVVVCGGGLAGFCAAVAAARGGAETCLVHNRPVLGGNSSSEIGVTPHGAAAFHAYARETGIISEALIEERYRNHAEIYENGWTNSVWDLVLYDLACRQEHLTVHLNTDVVDVVMDPTRARARGEGPEPETQNGYFHRPSLLEGPGRIAAVRARVLQAETELEIRGRIFIDCTGDALVADRAGCQWRMGSEGRDEFLEPHAPEHASTDTMGNSIHFLARDTGRPCPYQAPQWAIRHEDASYFYDQGRIPKDSRGGFWWLEIGVPYHPIHDNETIRHELTRHALGVWDWMKNRDPVMKSKVENYALDWLGQVPGKRESRRVMGRYLFTEDDVLGKTARADEIAFGGWFVDLHTPGGLLARQAEPTSADNNHNTFSEYSVLSYCGPYPLALGSLISRDVENLMMAGRNISTTHAALGTMRVMGTTALLGQAAGTAAALALQEGADLAGLCESASTARIQQRLLREGCFLLNSVNEDPDDLARRARVSVSSSARLFGAGPRTRGSHEGLGLWRDQPQYDEERLLQGRAQLIALGPEGIESLGLCLTNHSPEPQEVQAWIYRVEHIWDYRKHPGEALAQAALKVPPGENQWVQWPCDVQPGRQAPAGCFLRVDLDANEDVSWPASQAVLPGHVGYYQIGPEKMRRFANGSTLAFRVHPPQSVFAGENVISGVTRPYRGVNLWRSDPAEPLGQWVQLQWEQPETIARVELTFPGHLLREYHAYAPLYVDPQCARDYQVQVWEAGQWKTVAGARDNYQRRRCHVLARPIRTQRLRVRIDRTGADPSAAVYEIRCYGRS